MSRLEYDVGQLWDIHQTRGLLDERYSDLLLMALNQSRVAVSYKVHAHVEDGNPATANIIFNSFMKVNGRAKWEIQTTQPVARMMSCLRRMMSCLRQLHLLLEES